MMNRPYQEVDIFDTSERLLDQGQLLIRPNPIGGCQLFSRLAGSDHIYSIQILFVFDVICFASPSEVSVTYRQTEIFRHLVSGDNLPSSHADLGRRLGWPHLPCHTRSQSLHIGLSGRKQFLALMPTLLGQLRVVAGHQPFVGEFWASDLGQAFRLEVFLDQVAIGQQAADRAATQHRDPAQARIFLSILICVCVSIP